MILPGIAGDTANIFFFCSMSARLDKWRRLRLPR